MPTPSGLLKAGDRIKHSSDPTVYVVTRRLGNDISYAVRIRREDNRPFNHNGFIDKEHLFNEFDYALRHLGWSLVGGKGTEVHDELAASTRSKVLENLVSLNDIVTEMVRAMANGDVPDAAYVAVVRDTLTKHTHSLGFRTQEEQ
jgi:hypothetical protein